MSGNSALHRANKAKEDEFYTQLSDIEKELRHYKNHFEDKVVFCNCDDPYESNFFKYFCLELLTEEAHSRFYGLELSDSSRRSI